MAALAVVVAGAVGLAAVDRSDDGTSVATEGEDGPFRPAPAGVECVNVAGCPVEVTATQGLEDGDVVSVRIEGWWSNAATGISQCEDLDDPDDPDLALDPDGLPPPDLCNLEGLDSPAQTETSGADGSLSFDYVVRAGASMRDESVRGRCDAEHDCVLVVFLAFDTRLRSDASRVSIPLTFAEVGS